MRPGYRPLKPLRCACCSFSRLRSSSPARSRLVGRRVRAPVRSSRLRSARFLLAVLGFLARLVRASSLASCALPRSPRARFLARLCALPARPMHASCSLSWTAPLCLCLVSRGASRFRQTSKCAPPSPALATNAVQ